MEARAIVRNVRMTPRKIKLICDLIRWRSSSRAQLPMPRTITA